MRRTRPGDRLSYMSKNSTRVVVWWFLVLAGASAALLVAWAARVVRVPTATLLTVAAVVVALSWLVVLVTVPWNLYFAARRAAQEMGVARDRGIAVRSAYDPEARRRPNPRPRFAPGGHAGTADAGTR